jgi:hypothetical protein
MVEPEDSRKLEEERRAVISEFVGNYPGLNDAQKNTLIQIFMAACYSPCRMTRFEIPEITDEQLALCFGNCNGGIKNAIYRLIDYVNMPVMRDRSPNHEERNKWRAEVGTEYKETDPALLLAFNTLTITNPSSGGKITSTIGFLQLLGRKAERKGGHPALGKLLDGYGNYIYQIYEGTSPTTVPTGLDSPPLPINYNDINDFDQKLLRVELFRKTVVLSLNAVANFRPGDQIS